MSLQNLFVKAYLRATFYKKRRARLSVEERQAENRPEPPEKIAAKTERENVSVDGAKAVWLNKKGAANGALVYLHGGSYNAGPFDEQWEYIADMCARTNLAALVIDYRLAPQNPFPAGLDDSLIIIETLLASGDLPEKWFLLGDSAGGGLAAAVCCELRDAGIALPQKLILMSGWYDLTMSSPEIYKNEAIDPMLSVERMTEAADWYRGTENAENPLISPLFADVKNFPPTLMQCGTADLLVWENRRLYQKLKAAGVDARYEEYPKLFHDFMMIGFLPEAQKARRSQAEFLRS